MEKVASWTQLSIAKTAAAATLKAEFCQYFCLLFFKAVWGECDDLGMQFVSAYWIGGVYAYVIC